MHEVNANLVAVQWGVLSVFGVVVGLLLAPTAQYRKEFLASAMDEDRRRAVRWAMSVWGTSAAVMLALVGLSFLGAQDAKLTFTPGPLTTASWLLLTPLFAQAGFLALVLLLARPVPPLLTLPLQPVTDEASPGGRRPGTIIRFINDTSEAIAFQWIDFEGNKDKRRPRITPAGERIANTYQGHRFLIITTDGKALCTVVAAASPGLAVIKPAHLKSCS